MHLLGLDPGLQHTGWGVIETLGSRLRPLACGTLHTNPKLGTAARLVELHDGLAEIIGRFDLQEAAVEETFVNKNPATTLKLGQARGIVLLAPARAGLPVAEYSTNLVKKSVVGTGHATKDQIQMMVQRLLPGIQVDGPDAADALAVAICHAHHRLTLKTWSQGVSVGGSPPRTDPARAAVGGRQ